MPHKIGFVDNSNGDWAHYNLLALIRHFAGGFGDIGTVTYAGVGDGEIIAQEATPDAVTETWTLTCTASAALGGTFSVVGSVSGAQPDLTVGEPYANDYITLTIDAGDTADFEVGDEFEIPVTASPVDAAHRWEVLRYDTIAANRELILKGQGYTGEEEIFVGFRTYQNVDADYYNMVAAVFTGYVPGNTFDTQPGARLQGFCAHNMRIDYWLTLNPQRIVLGAKVGTPVYETAYVGKFLPYARPSQYPYPVVCSGTLNGAATLRYSDTSAAHAFGFTGNSVRMGMRSNDGWVNPYAYPWGNAVLTGTTQLRDTDGAYPLLPIELHDNTANLWGQLDGVFYISGFDNVTENTLTIEGVDYVVLQDVFRTGFTDYIAIRMD